MPSSTPGFVSVVIRPPGREPYTVPLERLTAHVRAARRLMGISRDELKKKRLRAVGVVSEQRQATSNMYDRIIEYGDKVAEARAVAEDAHMGDLNDQLRDLKEDLEELGEFAQAVPMKGAGGTAAPAKPTTTPGSGSAALAALNAAAPPRLAKDAWERGDAYVGTHPPETDAGTTHPDDTAVKP